jgi:hypothetical protein
MGLKSKSLVRNRMQVNVDYLTSDLMIKIVRDYDLTTSVSKINVQLAMEHGELKVRCNMCWIQCDEGWGSS